MIAGHEHERDVERVHQPPEVLEGQVTAAHDQLRAADRGHVRPQRLVHHVGDRQHPYH